MQAGYVPGFRIRNIAYWQNPADLDRLIKKLGNCGLVDSVNYAIKALHLGMRCKHTTA